MNAHTFPKASEPTVDDGGKMGAHPSSTDRVLGPSAPEPDKLSPPSVTPPCAADRKAQRIAYLERREADREARARAPVGWLDNYNDSADDLVRGLIRGFE